MDDHNRGREPKSHIQSQEQNQTYDSWIYEKLSKRKHT